MPRSVLVVPLASVPAEEAEARVRSYLPEDVDLKVIAPVSDLSPIDWLTNDEDAERRAALERAMEVADSAGTAHTTADIGDSDPLQAIEDALRTFPADEIVVVAPPEDDTTWLESDKAEEARRRFGAPVTRLTAAAGDTRR